MFSPRCFVCKENKTQTVQVNADLLSKGLEVSSLHTFSSHPPRMLGWNNCAAGKCIPPALTYLNLIYQGTAWTKD